MSSGKLIRPLIRPAALRRRLMLLNAAAAPRPLKPLPLRPHRRLLRPSQQLRRRDKRLQGNAGKSGEPTRQRIKPMASPKRLTSLNAVAAPRPLKPLPPRPNRRLLPRLRQRLRLLRLQHQRQPLLLPDRLPHHLLPPDPPLAFRKIRPGRTNSQPKLRLRRAALPILSCGSI